MRRKLFIFAAVVSLVLCVVTAAWWARSCWVFDNICRVGENKVVGVASGKGLLLLSVTRADPDNEDPGPRPYYVWHRDPVQRWLGVKVGGKFVRFAVTVHWGGYVFVVVPHCIVVLVTLPGGCWLLVRVWRSMRAKRRRNNGHCAACGYDLRATPERCPECGTERLCLDPAPNDVIRTMPQLEVSGNQHFTLRDFDEKPRVETEPDRARSNVGQFKRDILDVTLEFP
jgi:hypothetical protein